MTDSERDEIQKRMVEYERMMQERDEQQEELCRKMIEQDREADQAAEEEETRRYRIFLITMVVLSAIIVAFAVPLLFRALGMIVGYLQNH